MEHASPISLHYCLQREVQDTTGRHSVRRSQGSRTSLQMTLFYPVQAQSSAQQQPEASLKPNKLTCTERRQKL